MQKCKDNNFKIFFLIRMLKESPNDRENTKKILDFVNKSNFGKLLNFKTKKFYFK